MVKVYTVRLDNPKYPAMAFNNASKTSVAPTEPIFIKADVVLKSDYDLLAAKLAKAVELLTDCVTSIESDCQLDPVGYGTKLGCGWAFEQEAKLGREFLSTLKRDEKGEG